MNVERLVSSPLQNAKSRDGTQYSIVPNAAITTLTATGTIKYDSFCTQINSAATSAVNFSLLEANANQSGLVSNIKEGQTIKITLVAIGSGGSAVIRNTPTSLTTGATANVVTGPSGVVATMTLDTVGDSVTLKYVGRNQFYVIDQSGCIFA